MCPVIELYTFYFNYANALLTLVNYQDNLHWLLCPADMVIGYHQMVSLNHDASVS